MQCHQGCGGQGLRCNASRAVVPQTAVMRWHKGCGAVPPGLRCCHGCDHGAILTRNAALDWLQTCVLYVLAVLLCAANGCDSACHRSLRT